MKETNYLRKLKREHPFVDSKDLRRVIAERIRDNNVSVAKLCQLADVPAQTFVDYLGKRNSKRPYIKQHDLLKIIKYLGIDYAITIILKTEVDWERLQDRRKQAIQTAYARR